jgi:hypothetical protein
MKMTILGSVSTPTTLSDLANGTHLDIYAKARLRPINWYLHGLIRPSSHDDLVATEQEERTTQLLMILS